MNEDGSLGIGSLRAVARSRGAGAVAAGDWPPPPARAGVPGEILGRHLVGSDVLVLQVARPPGFSHEAGQYARLGLNGQSRKYSIASAPGERWLEFCIERVEGGRFTGALWRLRRGARLDVGATAKGSFRLADQGPHLMVATVTGIAPLLSMLRHALRDGAAPADARFAVIHGARFVDQLVYRPTLEAMAQQHPERLRYLPSVSQPGLPRNAGWDGAGGRVTAHLDAVARQLGLGPGGTVYACGHGDMLGAVAGHFGNRRIRQESYD